MKFVLVFFDGILIYSPTLEEHLKHLEIVFQLLGRHKLYAKMSKCEFGVEQVKYLGHVISREGVSIDEEKVEAMRNWPLPKTLEGLRGFLGLTGYYRRFVKDYGIIAKPLHDMLKRDQFEWNLEARNAFNQLKEIMSQTPILALPDFSQPFTLQYDASGVGIGAVSMQRGRPICYLSRILCPRNQRLSAYERELITIIQAVSH